MQTLHKHHIIPKHAGGTDDESNLVFLTVEQHAEAHRQLWEEHGRWQDYLAWQGLAGLIGKDEIVRMSHKLKGPKISAAVTGRQAWNKGKRNIYSKTTLQKMSDARSKEYVITFPDGHKEVVSNLLMRKHEIPYRALINKLYLKKGKSSVITQGPNTGWGIERYLPEN